MSKNLILSAAYGVHGQTIGRISLPFFEQYAKRCKADLIVVQSDTEWRNNEKMKLIAQHFDKGYDRIIWIDGDILIRPDCPNLFEIVPEDHFGAFEECSRWAEVTINHAHKQMVDICHKEKLPIPDSTSRYFNAGLQVIPSHIKHIYADPLHNENNWVYEQNLTNVRLFLDKNIKKFDLPDCFNMFVYHLACRRPESSSFVLHFAGPPSLQKRIDDMQHYARVWKARFSLPVVKLPYDLSKYGETGGGTNSNNVDIRHLAVLHDILQSGFIHTLEIGSYQGLTSSAFIEAMNTNALLTTYICDTLIQPNLQTVRNQAKRKESVHLWQMTSLKALESKVNFDFVYVDGDHGEQTVIPEAEALLKRKVRCVMAHDTNFALGPGRLKQMFQASGEYHWLEDNLPRPNERTERGLFLATTDQTLWKQARLIFQKWCEW